MAIIRVQQDRGITKDLTIQDANGDAIVPESNDKVRVIIGRAGHLGTNNEDAELEIESGSPTANGSSLKMNDPENGKHRLRLDASDLAAISPGIYTLFFDQFDKDDTDEWKTVDRQIFVLEET